MATTMKLLAIRTSATLRAVIDSIGAVNNASRALLWLGAGVAGLPISADGRREIARLLGDGSLAPDVHAALQRLYDGVPRTSATTAASAPASEHSPVALEVLPLTSAASASLTTARAPVPELEADSDDLFHTGFEFEG